MDYVCVSVCKWTAVTCTSVSVAYSGATLYWAQVKEGGNEGAYPLRSIALVKDMVAFKTFNE